MYGEKVKPGFKDCIVQSKKLLADSNVFDAGQNTQQLMLLQ